jgi:ribosomal protein L14E/L6E/L27E
MSRKKPVIDMVSKSPNLPFSTPDPCSTIPAPSRILPKLADVVISLNGRDAGKRFLVVGTEDEYSLLADGKSRKVEKPKRKKNKHIMLEDKCEGPVAEKIKNGEKVSNNEIRRTLAIYAEGCVEAIL